MNLFAEAITTNSSSSSFTAQGGGADFVAVIGTFDTCTVTLEFSPDAGTTWVATGSLTAAGLLNPTVPKGVPLRATVSSVGASTDVDVYTH